MDEIVDGYKPCPSCAEAVRVAATECRYCGYDFRAGTRHQLGPASSGVTIGGLLAIAAGALMVLGSFLPWVMVQAAFVGSISRSGMDGGADGILTLVMGLLTFLVGVGWIASLGLPRIVWITPIIWGLVAGVITLVDMKDVQDRVGELEQSAQGLATASVGAGLWALLVGSVLAIIAGLVIWSEGGMERREPPSGVS